MTTLVLMPFKKLILVFLILIILLNLYDKERVFYTPNQIPGSLMAMTIPPFGIIIEKQYKNQPNKPGSLIRHEKAHWGQYKRMGLLNFYYNYLIELIKDGRKKGPMETEARKLSYKK
jgi:hypothetical protein